MVNKLNPWMIFWAGFLFAVLAQIVHTIGAYATMGYYMMPEYFSVWSKIMMPNAGPPPLSFTVYALIFGAIGGILTAFVYGVVKNSVPGNRVSKKGLNYGLLIFMVAGIPSFLSMLLLINLPQTLILYWAVEWLIIDLLGGMLIARVMR
jgi:hypothetical protein